MRERDFGGENTHSEGLEDGGSDTFIKLALGGFMKEKEIFFFFFYCASTCAAFQ